MVLSLFFPIPLFTFIVLLLFLTVSHLKEFFFRWGIINTNCISANLDEFMTTFLCIALWKSSSCHPVTKPFLYPPRITIVLTFSNIYIEVPGLYILYKWSQRVWDFLCVASFAKIYVFEIHSRVACCDITYFHCSIIFHCATILQLICQFYLYSADRLFPTWDFYK